MSTLSNVMKMIYALHALFAHRPHNWKGELVVEWQREGKYDLRVTLELRSVLGIQGSDTDLSSCLPFLRWTVPPAHEEKYKTPQRTEEETVEESQHECSAPGMLVRPFNFYRLVLICLIIFDYFYTFLQQSVPSMFWNLQQQTTIYLSL